MACADTGLATLPFVRTDGRSTQMWSPDESGVWALDNKIGRGYADDTIRYIQERQAPQILGRIVKSMIDRGRYGGVEVGFAHRIASRASR